MTYVQFSAGQGPKECMRAVYLAQQQFQWEAKKQGFTVSELSCEAGDGGGTLRSILFSLEGSAATLDKIKSWVSTWQGTIQWICPSPYRPRHARKNWFIGVQVFEPLIHAADQKIRYEVCKARGPGGQHVNTTNTAVIAIHEASGLRVRIETERSQAANKKLATQLLAWRLLEQQKLLEQHSRAEQRLAHFQVERGAPIRTYEGEKFIFR